MKHILSPIPFGLILVLAVALAACGGAPGAEPTPPTIHYGEDACEICGMIITEERHAAAYLTEGGKDYVFDDIGDMVRSRLETQEEVVALFVHDYETSTWIRAETSHYVLSDRLTTPMASGLAAFASPEQARFLAAEFQGQVLTFDELLARYRVMAPMTMGKGSEQHSHDHSK